MVMPFKDWRGFNLHCDRNFCQCIRLIRMNLEEICINAGNWVDSAQDRNFWRALVNAALNLRVP